MDCTPLLFLSHFRCLRGRLMRNATQHGAAVVSSRASSFMWKCDNLQWQRGRSTAGPHTQTCMHAAGRPEDSAHLNETTNLTWHEPINIAATNTVTGCGCTAQQGWNVTYCYCSHLATIVDQRQLATQCLHADLCRNLRTAGSCRILLGSFNYLGIRSLGEQLLQW